MPAVLSTFPCARASCPILPKNWERTATVARISAERTRSSARPTTVSWHMKLLIGPAARKTQMVATVLRKRSELRPLRILIPSPIIYRSELRFPHQQNRHVRSVWGTPCPSSIKHRQTKLCRSIRFMWMRHEWLIWLVARLLQMLQPQIWQQAEISHRRQEQGQRSASGSRLGCCWLIIFELCDVFLYIYLLQQAITSSHQTAILFFLLFAPQETITFVTNTNSSTMSQRCCESQNPLQRFSHHSTLLLSRGGVTWFWNTNTNFTASLPYSFHFLGGVSLGSLYPICDDLLSLCSALVYPKVFFFLGKGERYPAPLESVSSYIWVRKWEGEWWESRYWKNQNSSIQWKL